MNFLNDIHSCEFNQTIQIVPSHLCDGKEFAATKQRRYTSLNSVNGIASDFAIEPLPKLYLNLW